METDLYKLLKTQVILIINVFNDRAIFDNRLICLTVIVDSVPFRFQKFFF